MQSWSCHCMETARQDCMGFGNIEWPPPLSPPLFPLFIGERLELLKNHRIGENQDFLVKIGGGVVYIVAGGS